MSRKAIVSLATERGNYYQGIARLADSLKDRSPGIDFIGFMGEESVGAPKHLENPYAFKVYALRHVIELGYDQVLWLDSSVVAIRDVSPVFAEIEKDGYFMQEAGHRIGSWCNDETLRYFRLSREDAMNMGCYGNAGMLGLNFDTITGIQFFTRWNNAMEAGMFKGSWDNHRHDLSCGSIIASRLGMIYKSGNEWLDYAAPWATPKNNTIIFHAAGM